MRPTARGSSRESKLHGTLRAARALLDPLERRGPAPPPMPPARPAGPSPAPMQAELAASVKVNPRSMFYGLYTAAALPLCHDPGESYRLKQKRKTGLLGRAEKSN